mgnify:FL=1
MLSLSKHLAFWVFRLMQSFPCGTQNPMNENSGFDIEHMAVLARIKLTPDEKARISGQMGTILAYIEKLKEVNTDDVEPTAHVLGLKNVFRDDEPAPKPLADHNPISDSPAHDKGHYEVPQIL